MSDVESNGVRATYIFLSSCTCGHIRTLAQAFSNGDKLVTFRLQCLDSIRQECVCGASCKNNLSVTWNVKRMAWRRHVHSVSWFKAKMLLGCLLMRLLYDASDSLTDAPTESPESKSQRTRDCPLAPATFLTFGCKHA